MNFFQSKTEEEVERKGRHVGKLEMSVKTLTDELVKANEIIKKQHTDLKSYHNKVVLHFFLFLFTGI